MWWIIDKINLLIDFIHNNKEKIFSIYNHAKDNLYIPKPLKIFFKLILLVSLLIFTLFIFVTYNNQINFIFNRVGFGNYVDVRNFLHPSQDYVSLDNVVKDGINDLKDSINQRVKELFLEANINYDKNNDPVDDIVTIELAVSEDEQEIQTSLSWYNLSDYNKLKNYKYRNYNISVKDISNKCHGIFDDIFEKVSKEKIDNKIPLCKDFRVYLYMKCPDIKVLELINKPEEKFVYVCIIPLSRRKRSVMLFVGKDIPHRDIIINAIDGSKKIVTNWYKMKQIQEDAERKLKDKLIYASRKN